MRQGSGRSLLVLDDFGGGDGYSCPAVHVDAEGGVFGDVAPRAGHFGVAADDESVLPVVKPTKVIIGYGASSWCMHGDRRFTRS